MVKGLLTYTYPDAPDVTPVQDHSTIWLVWSVFFGGGNQFLHWLNSPCWELLGMDKKVPKSIFTDGITASVKGYDYVAGQNHIPYYDSPYVNDLMMYLLSCKMNG